MIPATILQISYTLSNIENAADQFWQCANQYNIFAFSGEMGAGKTTFIHTLCALLGVTDSVSSPTFSLVNEYHYDEHGSDRTIFHMDWYRLKDADEAIGAGIEDYLFAEHSYSIIEWPEKAVELLPKPHLWVSIVSVSDTERTMTVSVIE